MMDKVLILYLENDYINNYSFFVYNSNGDNMSLKLVKVIGVFVIYFLAFVFHSVYDLFPSFLTSIFFPVNESVWEHMKLLYFPILIWSVIEYFLIRKHDKKFNYLFQAFLTSYFSIILYLILYGLITMFVSESFVLSIILLFLVIVITEIVGYFIFERLNYSKGLNIVGLLGIVAGVFIFGILSYYPIEVGLFYDSIKANYGILKK